MWNLRTKQNGLLDTENRLVVTRGSEGGLGKVCEGGQKVQTSSYKISMSWGCNTAQRDDYS